MGANTGAVIHRREADVRRAVLAVILLRPGPERGS
jgi:hypothetical protein